MTRQDTIHPFPVLRAGAVLRAKDDHGFTPEESVHVGRALNRAAGPLALRFMEEAPEIVPQIGKMSLPPNETATTRARLRFAPTLTADFQPIRFEWNGLNFETRPVITMCPGDTRGKIWVRLSAIDAPNDPSRLNEIKTCFFEWAPALKSLWLDYYNEVCRDTTPDIQFDPVYAINIFMMSSDGEKYAVRRLLDEFSDAKSGDRPTEADALRTLGAELRETAGIQLPVTHARDAMRKIVSYRFPRQEIDPEQSSVFGVRVETLADQGYEALCAVEMEPTRANVFGVGLEPVRPDSFRRSASHVASAEISYEMGRVF